VNLGGEICVCNDNFLVEGQRVGVKKGHLGRVGF